MPSPRSPPRPSPGGLHYSDEDLCNKYNGAALTESGALQEKPGDATESEVGARALLRAAAPPVAPGPCPGLSRVSTHTHRLGAGRAGTEGAPSRTGRVHARLWCARPPPRSVPGPEWTLGSQTSLLSSALRKRPGRPEGHQGTWWPLDPRGVTGARTHPTGRTWTPAHARQGLRLPPASCAPARALVTAPLGQLPGSPEQGGSPGTRETPPPRGISLQP